MSLPSMTGVRFNSQGFVLMRAGGRLVCDSAVSAHSQRSIVPGGVLEKVPGVDGLFYRLAPAEAGTLSKAQRTALHKAAKEWQEAVEAQLEVEAAEVTAQIPTGPDPFADDDEDDDTDPLLLDDLP